MNLESEFSHLNPQEVADIIIYKYTGQHLRDIELTVLQASYQGKTYDDMATTYGYSAEYLNKDVGNKLWHKLSQALSEKVTKKNFKAALTRVWEKYSVPGTKNLEIPTPPLETQLPFPESSVPPHSAFYIERNNLENLCYEIIKPGALIRIKAPKLMGKTSLINKIITYAASANYQTVYLDLSK